MADHASLRVTGLREAEAVLERFDQPQFDRAAQRVLLAAARGLVAPIRQATDFKGHGKTPGRLRASVRARRGVPAKLLPAAVVGPTAPYAHLVIQGHRIRGSNARTRPNPFVDRGIDGQEERVKVFVERQLAREMKL